MLTAEFGAQLETGVVGRTAHPAAADDNGALDQLRAVDGGAVDGGADEVDPRRGRNVPLPAELTKNKSRRPVCMWLI